MQIGLSMGLSGVANRGGGPAGKTYAEFQAHIAGLATSGSKNWNAFSTNWGAWRVTAGAPVGSMVGSSWNSSFSGQDGGSTPCRVVQHGLPSQAEFNAQIAAGRMIFLRVVAGDDVGYPSVTRNGYTSSSGGPDAFADKCSELIYWDGAQAQRMQPALGLGPSPYTW